VLDLFSEELLTPARRAQVERHLSSCPSCAAKAGRLRAPRAVAASAPAGLKSRLRAALAAAPAGAIPVPDPRVSRDGRGALLALVVFSLSLLALHALTPGIPSERPVTSDAAPWRLP
jgi:anti-sigma factor RsiW